MKKLLAYAAVLILVLALAAGCGQAAPSSSQAPSSEAPSSEAPSSEAPALKPIKVGATPAPHAEILEQVKPVLEAEGYALEIVVFTDYVLPNTALHEGSLDANYFQHLPYLDKFNAEQKTDLSSAAVIHYEPYGLYAGKTKTLAEIKDGATIAVPNDPSNEARALLLLEAQGLITLKEGAGITATVNDIAENPKKIKIHELEAAQLARSLADVDFAVINGNYAIEAGLNAATDALAIEDKDSIAADTYGNIIAVRTGDESREEIQALIKALQSDAVRKFIEEKYAGAVVAKF